MKCEKPTKIIFYYDRTLQRIRTVGVYHVFGRVCDPCHAPSSEQSIRWVGHNGTSGAIPRSDLILIYSEVPGGYS
jgi:hypothetical protein